MADKANQGLPLDWDDDDRMNFMFSAFAESREVNPKHWDSKLHFWNKAILDSCKSHGDVSIDLTTLRRRFSRNGLTPLGLSTVIREMLRRGKLERKVDFLNCGGEGWLSWSYGWARRSFWWSVGTFWGENSSVNPNEQFVLVDEAKENANSILCQHYDCVQCETTDHVIPWNVLKMRCKVFDDETLSVLLASLQKRSKAVLSFTAEGEKIVKFARKTEPKVSPVSESDMDIVRLRKTVARLTVQVNNLSSEVESCRLQAASFVKEGLGSKALRLLKKKELRQRTLNKALANLSSLEEILHRIQHANTNKMVIDALKSGTASLNSLHAQISVESVEDVVDDLNETLRVSQDIDTAILKGTSETSGIGSEELDELEKELGSLLINDQDTVAAVQSTSSHPRPGNDTTSTADHPSNSSSSRQLPSVTQELDMERDTSNLPDVPSHSPNKTEILRSRNKAVLLT